jgi:endonuclease/exonuclease/phosphatase family metal-dependent hydrolase
MGHVYHAACAHVSTGRDFGNAILSRWPLGGDEKIELPHRSLVDRSARAATLATVATPVGLVVVASVHLATRFEQTPRARRRQLAALIDRLRGTQAVVIGGDFNGHRVVRAARAAGFEWPTRALGGRLGRWKAIDHIVVRGLHVRQVGRVTDTRDATDHPAVWVDLVRAGEPGSTR